MKEFHLEEACTVRCHLCKKQVTFGSVKNRTTVLHELPYCKAFEEANTTDEVIAYMKRCRPLQEN